MGLVLLSIDLIIQEKNTGLLAMYQGFYSTRVMLPVTYMKEFQAWGSPLA